MTEREPYTDHTEHDTAQREQVHADLQKMGETALPGFSTRIDLLRLELEGLTKLFKLKDPYAKDPIHRDTSLAIQALREAASWIRDAASRIPAPTDDTQDTLRPQPVTRSIRPESRPATDPRTVRHLDLVRVDPPTVQPNPQPSHPE